MRAPDIRPFEDRDLDGAADLLARRHRSQRRFAPALDARFEEPEHARAELEALWSGDRVTSLVAELDGALVGYLIGVHRDRTVWGPNVWVDGAAHAADDPELIRDLYAAAAQDWVASGRTSHYVVVPATDHGLVDAWFRLGFGQQQIHALTNVRGDDELPPARPGAGLAIRRAERDDLDDVARLSLVLPEYQAGSPTFSRLAPPTFDEARREWEADWDDPRFVTFVAEQRGTVVGLALGCPVTVSGLNHGVMRPSDAGLLGYAAVLPEARGLGAGRLLGEAVLDWARAEGWRTVVVDWRATNLTASRAWPRLGFVPTFLRLHRAIAG